MSKKIISVGLLVVFLSMAVNVFAQDVYRTKNGKKFHTVDCPLIKNKKPQQITRQEALEKGLTPCSKCFKDEVSASINTDAKKIVSTKKNKKEVE